MDPPTINEIWVAAGTYKPDQYSSNPSGTGDRDETFTLINGVEIYGGFQPGLGIDTFEERNPEVYLAILSGDIGASQDTSDNSFHVVTADGVNASAALNGFRIQAGNADAGRGGGLFICNAEPFVVRCRFSRNTAGKGGAVGFGEAVCGGQEPFFVNCQFLSNLATADGGAVYVNGSRFAEFHNCVFDGNNAQGGKGGAIFILCDGFSQGSVRLRNCTFSRNLAGSGGGAMGLGPDEPCFVASEVANCILWDDSPDEVLVVNPSENPDITYSNIDGDWPGPGNIDADPVFVDPGSSNFRLDDGSPCVNVGSNAALPADVTDLDEDGNPTEPLPWDLDKNPRIANQMVDVVDMGAYEQHFVFNSADLDGNGQIGPTDLSLMLANWGSCPGCDADLNGDSVVGGLDYANLLEAWEAAGQPSLATALENASQVLGFASVDAYQSWLAEAVDPEAQTSAQILLAPFWS